MLIKYKIYYSDYSIIARIDKVDVEKETEKSVWIRGQRLDKRSIWENYIDSREEAKSLLIEWQTKRVKNLRKGLLDAERILADAKSL